ncbi:MAG: 60S ribosomal export protein NMD3, partial [Desulfurococcales archaeon]|nr:60S ribosomal export protein NMD3 [Desulfurococcales archaeon]
YGIARLPAVVEVEVCRHCGAVRLGHRWLPSGGTFEGALERVLEWLASRLEPVEPLEAAEVAGYTLRSEPNWTTRLALRVRGAGPGGVEAEAEVPLTVRLRPTICPRCKVQVSGEYQVLVQVRAPRRLRGRLMGLVEEAAARSGVGGDVIEAVETRDGVDVYLTHRGAASRLLSALRRVAPLRVTGPHREYVGITSRGKRRTRDTYVARIEEA